MVRLQNNDKLTNSTKKDPVKQSFVLNVNAQNKQLASHITNLTLHRSDFSGYDRPTLSLAQSKNFSTSSLGSNLLSQLGTAPMTDDGVNACEAETNLKSPEVRGYL